MWWTSYGPCSASTTGGRTGRCSRSGSARTSTACGSAPCPADWAGAATAAGVAIDHHRVRLFPRDAWWSALFNDEPHETEVYCDITTPAEISHDPFGDTITAVDLDLDVRRMRDGTVRILDEDEFAAHQVKYGYPDKVIDTARATCDWVAANITTAEPFKSAYRMYLERVRELAPVP